MNYAIELNLTKKQALIVLKKKVTINEWAFNQVKNCKLCKHNKVLGWRFCIEHFDNKALTQEKMALAFRQIVKQANLKVSQ